MSEKLSEILRDLSQEGPPAGLEARVMEQYRMRRRPKAFAGFWALAAAAMVALWFVVPQKQPSAPVSLPTSNASTRPPNGVATPLFSTAAIPSALPTPVRKLKSRRRPTPQPVEAPTAFYRIPGTELLPAAYNASILRYEMSPESVRGYGFEVPTRRRETVRADFLVGEDGMARAIRLVQ